MVADVVFLIDESSSLKEQKNFNLELNFVSNVVDNMDIGPRKTQVCTMHKFCIVLIRLKMVYTS